MNILLIEDDDDIRELIAVIFETKLGATVFQANSVAKALALLKNQTFACVFSDYHLPDGTGGTVYQKMLAEGKKIPFILCSTDHPHEKPEFDGLKDVPFVQKPFRTTTIVDAVSQTIPNESVREAIKQLEYCPVRLLTLLESSELTCDFYVKIADSKYLKVVRQGDSFTSEDYERFSSKHIDYLYMQSKDSKEFLERYSKDVLSLVQAKDLGRAEAYEASIQNYQIIHQAISCLGLTPEVQALTIFSTQLAIRTIANDPGVILHFENMMQKKHKFLSTHSLLLVQFASYLASLMGWTSETTQYKLALAAMLHDVLLKDDEMAGTELTLNLDGAPPEFLSHPEQVARLAKGMKSIPSDVDSIIMSHHERPDGSGFPRHLKASEIGPLPALFIVAHDLVNYMWLQESNGTLGKFLNLYADDYKVGHFKKIHLELSKAVASMTGTASIAGSV